MFKKFIGMHLAGIVMLAASIACVGLLLWRSTSASTNMSFSETKLSEIKEMVKLCSLEVRDDIAFKDSINGKWIFAKSTVNGYIRFDLERLDYQLRNDSVFVILPPEEIDIYESTSDNAYEVIDTWDSSLLGLRKLTAAEENAIKKRMAAHYKKSFYSKGYVKRARASAISTLSRLFSKMDPNITVIDLRPDGYGERNQ